MKPASERHTDRRGKQRSHQRHDPTHTDGDHQQRHQGERHRQGRVTAREGVPLAEPEQAGALERRLENQGRYIRARDYRGRGHRQARLLAHHGSEENRATQEHSGRHGDRLHQAIAKVDSHERLPACTWRVVDPLPSLSPHEHEVQRRNEQRARRGQRKQPSRGGGGVGSRRRHAWILLGCAPMLSAYASARFIHAAPVPSERDDRANRAPCVAPHPVFIHPKA